jgi:hypothetical protein
MWVKRRAEERESERKNKKRCILDKVLMATLFKKKTRDKERERKETKRKKDDYEIYISTNLYVTLHVSFLFFKTKKMRNTSIDT